MPAEALAKEGIQAHQQEHETLKKLGFKTNTHNQYCKNIEEVFHFYEHVEKIRPKIPYEIDGVVVKVGDRIYDGSLKRRLTVLRRKMVGE